MAIETFFCFFSLVACSFKEKEKKPRNFEVAQLFVLGFFYYLNSAVFFFVRKFYMLRRLFGALYVDMRCFGVSWLFSKHKIPQPKPWGSMITTKNTSITECFAATSTFTQYRFETSAKLSFIEKIWLI